MGITTDRITSDDRNAKNIKMSGVSGRLKMGGGGVNGDIVMFPEAGDITNNATATIRMIAERANLKMGGSNEDGDILLYPKNGNIEDTGQTATIRLDGESGNIIIAGDLSLQAADCAEEFDIIEGGDVGPGAVVVLTDTGHIRESSHAYDKRVMGVVSGAGQFRPGIVLDRQTSAGQRAAVAMMGKVYCQVDADFGEIEIGDLLSTSTTPGHAMKATDTARAFGAVIGKAMRPWDQGVGLIPVLVSRL
ncbi:hypothetical protein ACW9HR_35860 [Nocardia gipuzkoensis]